jgi:uncharacterized protein (UPF0332 family)
MAFDWHDYFKLAELWKGSRTEDYWRCTVSRAYYAAYHQVQATVRARYQYTAPGPDKHRQLWDYLMNNSRTADEKKVGIDGDRLRDDRNHADYIMKPLTQADAIKACTVAARLIDKIKNPAS